MFWLWWWEDLNNRIYYIYNGEEKMADEIMNKYHICINKSLSNIDNFDKNELHQNLRTIAKEEIKSMLDQDRYVAFIIKWVEHEPNYTFSTQYLREWANRFNKKDEYAKADYEKTKYLIDVDGNEDGYNRIRDMYKQYGWKTESINKEIMHIENEIKSIGKPTNRKRSKPKKAKPTFRSGNSQGKDMIKNMNRMTGTTLRRFR